MGGRLNVIALEWSMMARGQRGMRARMKRACRAVEDVKYRVKLIRFLERWNKNGLRDV